MDDLPPERGPGYGAERGRYPAEYERPPPEPEPALRLAPARTVRLVDGRQRQPLVFAPEPLPETSRLKLLDPPTAGYNPYGRAVREEEPVQPPPVRHRSVVAVREVRPQIAYVVAPALPMQGKLGCYGMPSAPCCSPYPLLAA